MKSRQRRTDYTSTVLMLIVTVMVITSLPRIILNMHEITVVEDISRCR